MEFEQLLKQLEQTISKLDDPQTTLDDGIRLFDEGIRISKECLTALSEAKGKIVLLKKEMDKVTAEDLPIDNE